MHGLGFSSMYDTHSPSQIEEAKLGIIELKPYYNPWCWMNDGTVLFADTLVDVLKQHFGL